MSLFNTNSYMCVVLSKQIPVISVISEKVTLPMVLKDLFMLLSAFFPLFEGGGRVVRWCWVNFQCRGVLLIWIREGQGPAALAVGAGWDCLDIFFLSSIFSFYLSLADGPI